MTSLNPDPLVVALVQAANTFPIFLFALPAGAFADIFDKRKYLIVVETLYTVVFAVYAAVVWFGFATPGNLLLFTLLINARHGTHSQFSGKFLERSDCSLRSWGSAPHIS